MYTKDIDTVLTLERSIYLLEGFKDFKKPRCAIDYLERIGNEYRLLALYQQLFPDNFSTSSASYYSRDGNAPLSKRANEFLQLIDRYLFPLDLTSDSCVWNESNFLTIPIIPMGMGRVEAYQISYYELDRGIKLLLPLSSSGRDYLEFGVDEETEENLLHWYRSESIELTSIERSNLTHPDNIDYKYLNQLAHQTSPPIKFLPLALRFIDLKTKNVWLDEPGYDRNEDECTRFTFSYQSILFLQREWTKAQAITNAVFSLFDWLEYDDRRFKQILKLWKKASITQK